MSLVSEYGKVSIIMPVYNTGRYIKDSIESILAQTYLNWELLLIDDCSSDNSKEIIEQYLSDSRIRYERNVTNLGAALSRNKALKMATGRWIAFLDSDDIWKKEKLERQLKFMIDYEYAFTYTDYRIESNGQWSEYVNTAPDYINKRRIYRYCYFSTITVMYERDRIGLIQIKDLKKNNDYLMWLRMIEKSDAYRLPECLAFYIKHNDSISSGSKFKLIKYHYKMFNYGMGYGRMISTLYTIRNLFFGVIKKFKYKRQAYDNDLPNTTRVLMN